MAYTLLKSDGSTLAVVSANTVDTSTTSIALHGQGRLLYGQKVDENFIHMLEHFANVVPPVNPIVGQIWLDTSAGSGSPVLGVLKFFDNSGNWQSLLSPSGFDDLLVSGDLLFTIPSVGLPTNSSGIKWTGNTDEMRMYVEEFSTESSELIIQISNDGGDQSAAIADGLSIRGLILGEPFPATIARFVKQQGKSGVMLMTADTGVGSPQRSNNLAGDYTIIFNEGGGNSDISGAPDIRFKEQGFISAGNALYLNINDTFTNNVPNSALVITSGGSNSSNATEIARFDSTGNFHCAFNVFDTIGSAGAASAFLGGVGTASVNVGSSNSNISELFAWNTAVGVMNFTCNRITAVDTEFTPQGWSINANVKRIINVNNGINGLDAVNVNQLNAAISGASSSKFFSPLLPPIFNSLHTVAHGLGTVPDILQLFIINVSAVGGNAFGWPIGTHIPLNPTTSDIDEASGVHTSTNVIVSDATNIQFGMFTGGGVAGYFIPNLVAGGVVGIVGGMGWSIQARAYII